MCCSLFCLKKFQESISVIFTFNKILKNPTFWNTHFQFHYDIKGAILCVFDHVSPSKMKWKMLSLYFETFLFTRCFGWRIMWRSTPKMATTSCPTLGTSSSVRPSYETWATTRAGQRTWQPGAWVNPPHSLSMVRFLPPQPLLKKWHLPPPPHTHTQIKEEKKW